MTTSVSPTITPLEWAIFGAVVLAMLIVDLLAHRGEKGESRRAAIIWSIVWIAIGLAFTFYVWIRIGGPYAERYLAAYVIEKSLSLDNLFVFLIIFRTLNIPKDNQRKGLTWGIFGAIVFRGIFIFLGAAALRRWEWVEYIFAGILVLAAWHAWREDPARVQESKVVRWLSRRLPVSPDSRHPGFIVRESGRWKVTPLLVAVIALELTDIMFAIDSVPAAFSVSRNEFIVYSSNIFAILGLRALYIALAKTIAELRYLHYGLTAVLLFAAFKMLSDAWFHIPPLVSVGIIVLCIGISVWASVRAGRREQPDDVVQNEGPGEQRERRRKAGRHGDRP